MSKIPFLFLALLLAYESNALNLINKDDKDSKVHQRVQRALIIYQPWLTVSIQFSIIGVSQTGLGVTVFTSLGNGRHEE